LQSLFSAFTRKWTTSVERKRRESPLQVMDNKPLLEPLAGVPLWRSCCSVECLETAGRLPPDRWASRAGMRALVREVDVRLPLLCQMRMALAFPPLARPPTSPISNRGFFAQHSQVVRQYKAWSSESQSFRCNRIHKRGSEMLCTVDDRIRMYAMSCR
jgi:hypothetical protein